MHIEGLVSELNTFGYRANLVTCNFHTHFSDFRLQFEGLLSILLHETPQTIRYMSVVYAYWSIMSKLNTFGCRANIVTRCQR